MILQVGGGISLTLFLLLDYLHFDLTNPMVPDLSNVFIGSQGQFRKEVILGNNGYFIGFGHFHPTNKLVKKLKELFPRMLHLRQKWK